MAHGIASLEAGMDTMSQIASTPVVMFKIYLITDGKAFGLGHFLVVTLSIVVRFPNI